MMCVSVSGKDGTTLLCGMPAKAWAIQAPNVRSLSAEVRGRDVLLSWPQPEKNDHPSSDPNSCGKSPLAELRLTLRVQCTRGDGERGAGMATFTDVPSEPGAHVLTLPLDEVLLAAVAGTDAAPPRSLTLHVDAQSISSKGAMGWGRVTSEPWEHALG